MKKKQYTGKPGRPREINISGGPTSDPIPVHRLSVTTGIEGSPKGVERLSGSTGKISGVEIVSKEERKSIS